MKLVKVQSHQITRVIEHLSVQIKSQQYNPGYGKMHPIIQVGSSISIVTLLELEWHSLHR